MPIEFKCHNSIYDKRKEDNFNNYFDIIWKDLE